MEQSTYLALRRDAGGLQVTIRVHPKIEAAIRSWGEGVTQRVLTYGRQWEPVGTDPLLAMALPEAIATKAHRFDAGRYQLSGLGQPLVPYGEDQEYPLINLSMIRLVGIGAGVTFKVKGIYSREYVKDTTDGLRGALSQFYLDYLKPIERVINITTQEVR